jgi:hypothetical protein
MQNYGRTVILWECVNITVYHELGELENESGIISLLKWT